LSNFETSKDKLLQILLVGQPELALRLNSPELRQLKQRVMLRHHLRVLSLQECCEYVSNRLKVAGAARAIFTPNALESVYSYSNGIPRIVNVLCDNALLNGYALGKKEIEAGIIREVAEDLNITANAEARFKSIRQVINNPNGNVSAQGFSAGSVETRSGVVRLEPKPLVLKQPPKSLFPTASVPPTFLDALAAVLTEAMGPMAKIVLRDQLKILGESYERFPHTKVEMLLESVSREILDKGMRRQFRQRMLERIQTLQAS
jgi:general secretion pathway protein A